MVLGPASVRWNDYLGTAAADDADAISQTRSLYELSGLDRERWTIVGIDVTLWEQQRSVTVYALDRLTYQVESHDDIDELSRSQGNLPVTAFHLTSPAQVDGFLSAAFTRVVVRLLARGVRDEQLLVEAEQPASTV